MMKKGGEGYRAMGIQAAFLLYRHPAILLCPLQL